MAGYFENLVVLAVHKAERFSRHHAAGHMHGVARGIAGLKPVINFENVLKLEPELNAQVHGQFGFIEAGKVGFALPGMPGAHHGAAKLKMGIRWGACGLLGLPGPGFTGAGPPAMKEYRQTFMQEKFVCLIENARSMARILSL
mgnify:CR=1 FL=1